MTKAYRDWSSDQSYLFPPSPHDWLPEGDLVYFLTDTVATLDLSPIFAYYTVADPVLPSVRYDGWCPLGPRSQGEQRLSLQEGGTDCLCGLRLRSPVSPDLADSRPQATAGSTSTIANRSVISVDNSSR